MSDPQDVRLNLPDGTAVRPSETRHSVTETGQRWDYTFSLETTPIDPAVQQCVVMGCAEPWVYDAVCVEHWEELDAARQELRAGRKVADG